MYISQTSKFYLAFRTLSCVQGIEMEENGRATNSDRRQETHQMNFNARQGNVQ